MITRWHHARGEAEPWVIVSARINGVVDHRCLFYDRCNTTAYIGAGQLGQGQDGLVSLFESERQPRRRKSSRYSAESLLSHC